MDNDREAESIHVPSYEHLVGTWLTLQGLWNQDFPEANWSVRYLKVRGNWGEVGCGGDYPGSQCLRPLLWSLVHLP